MPAALTGISSMATRQLLAELAARWQQHAGTPLAIESTGGVDAARRVQGGEAFDVVFLAAGAIDKLVAAGAAVAGSRVDLVRSPMAVAVRAGAARPDISTESALRDAVRAAGRVAYSTGPSGDHLLRLVERWDPAGALRARCVQAPPGLPVGELVARGDAELGFQQLAELTNLSGVELLGTLPPPCEHTTVFAGAVCTASRRAGEVRGLLAWIASPAADDAIRRHGMLPARDAAPTTPDAKEPRA